MNENGLIVGDGIDELRAGVESLKDFVADHDQAVAVKAAIAHADQFRFWAGPRGQLVEAPEPVVAALDAAEIPAGPRRDAAIAAAHAAYKVRIVATWPWRTADDAEPVMCEPCRGTGSIWGEPACSHCGGYGTVPEDGTDDDKQF